MPILNSLVVASAVLSSTVSVQQQAFQTYHEITPYHSTVRVTNVYPSGNDAVVSRVEFVTYRSTCVSSFSQNGYQVPFTYGGAYVTALCVHAPRGEVYNIRHRWDTYLRVVN